mmetsp:Transcript_33424/g.78831  ORF Transcript_33424/g.78831 Transcript_33424/m.78831 type:complete len:206 (-) Transcript_33424:113-730(-)
MRHHGLRGVGDFPGHAPPVGVAHDQAPRAGVDRRFAACQSVLWIGLVAIKEVFQVHQDRFSEAREIGDGILDHVQVFLPRRPQYFRDLPRVGLDHHADGWHVGFDQRLDLRIVLDRQVFAAARAKGDQPGAGVLGQFRLGPPEEFQILRIAPGPSGLDVIDPKVGETGGNLELVFARRRYLLTLRAVPQCRVKDQAFPRAPDKAR